VSQSIISFTLYFSSKFSLVTSFSSFCSNFFSFISSQFLIISFFVCVVSSFTIFILFSNLVLSNFSVFHKVKPYHKKQKSKIIMTNLLLFNCLIFFLLIFTFSKNLFGKNQNEANNKNITINISEIFFKLKIQTIRVKRNKNQRIILITYKICFILISKIIIFK
jgi:hypothetical protein